MTKIFFNKKKQGFTVPYVYIKSLPPIHENAHVNPIPKRGKRWEEGADPIEFCSDPDPIRGPDSDP